MEDESFQSRGAVRRAAAWVVLVAAALWGDRSTAQDRRNDDEASRPRTFFVTRSQASEQLFPYLEAARPELVQIGQYGAMFHGLADDEKGTRSPMMLPLVGERANLDFQRQLNARLHQRGHTVVGHFRLIKVYADWNEQNGFIRYYNERWPEELLGPKPHADLRELLARDAEGMPIALSRYGQGQLGFCLSSPHARQMFKQMLKLAIDHGVDGVITTYNYRYDCACSYCQEDFKKWLKQSLSPAELTEKLGVADLDAHTFAEIPAAVPGYPEDPSAATDLDWLALRWGAEHFKKRYDEIFVDYGRSLKPDLIVAQWNHLSQVSIKEEKMFLPFELWGKDEDYFWFSGGASFVGKKLDLQQGLAGDAWLSSLYLREMGCRKPFVMGKYDGVRMAASMAEGYALGGLGMGRYMRFEDPHAFEVLSRYSRFRDQKRELFDDAVPFSDAALVLPRQSVWNGRPDALDEFRALGQALVERQVLIDVLADENINAQRLAEYPAVILPNVVALSDGQVESLRTFAEEGGVVIVRGTETGFLDEAGRTRKRSPIAGMIGMAMDGVDSAADAIAKELHRRGASNLQSPWTVRAAAFTMPRRLLLHLVNYNRDESKPADRSVKGPMLERPIAEEAITVRLRLPEGTAGVVSATLHAADRDTAVELPFEMEADEGHVTFTIPRLLVYAVVALKLEADQH